MLPYASHAPYPLRILRREHQSSFGRIAPSGLGAIAEALRGHGCGSIALPTRSRSSKHGRRLNLLSSHPPIEVRIARLREMAV